MSIRQFSILAALMGATDAAGCSAAGYNYDDDQGADWKDIVCDAGKVNECGEKNQSPIDLFTEDNAGFNYKIYEAKDDFGDGVGDRASYKDYSNQFDTLVENTGDTTKVTLNTAFGANYYESNIAESVFGAINKKWEGAQFHLHAGSEHTINGERYDLEMHTVHLPPAGVTPADGQIKYSAMGIMFDVERHTADLTFAEQQVIDIFFDSMGWDENGPTADLVAYGSLMEMVDFRNRWVYKGSVTTPPCSRFVYWNVISTIYPVSQKHLDLFRARLNEGTSGLGTGDPALVGNFRRINPIDDHNVIYVKNGYESQLKELMSEKPKGLIAATVILGLIAFFALIGCAVFGVQAQGQGSGGEKAPKEAEMAEQPKADE